MTQSLRRVGVPEGLTAEHPGPGGARVRQHDPQFYTIFQILGQFVNSRDLRKTVEARAFEVLSVFFRSDKADPELWRQASIAVSLLAGLAELRDSTQTDDFGGIER